MTVARRKGIDFDPATAQPGNCRRAVGARCGMARSRSGRCGDSGPASRLDVRLAHPAIDPNVRAPLMLQAVLGLNAATIASAFLMSPATMGQRLVRAQEQDQAGRHSVSDPRA